VPRPAAEGATALSTSMWTRPPAKDSTHAGRRPRAQALTPRTLSFLSVCRARGIGRRMQNYPSCSWTLQWSADLTATEERTALAEIQRAAGTALFVYQSACCRARGAAEGASVRWRTWSDGRRELCQLSTRRSDWEPIRKQSSGFEERRVGRPAATQDRKRNGTTESGAFAGRLLLTFRMWSADGVFQL
jgi:hypothetical protein